EDQLECWLDDYRRPLADVTSLRPA
ncbi:MAG: hypothetical protein QOE84_1964, partial [Actinomycetota bacterium]|nr:hypothetical protein [Actinomycetota bacterium]